MRNSQIANPNPTTEQQKKLAIMKKCAILFFRNTQALTNTAIPTPPKRRRSKMNITEIATIAISVITVAITIYKTAQNDTLLTTVIKGVEASTTPGSHIKTTIAHHAEKAGLKYALHKVVKKITDK